jgi:hypothetical protein
MTLRIPSLSVTDRLLRILGKRRALIIPVGAYEKFGPYVIAMAKKEPFLKALLRPKAKALPPGTIDLFSFCEALTEESTQRPEPSEQAPGSTPHGSNHRDR